VRVLVGTAPDSWGVWFPGEAEQTPWPRFLDEVSSAGYRWLELGPYGYLPVDADLLNMELQRRQLAVSATFVMQNLEAPDAWETLSTAVEETAALLTGVGAKYLVLIDDVYVDLETGVQTAPAELTDGEWRRLVDNTNRVAELARGFGLRTVFHPHVQSHVENEYQIDRLLTDTEPGRVDLCFDIGHHAYLGLDPISFIRDHHERIPYLHLKSVDPAVLQRVNDKRVSFAQAVEMEVFVDPEHGSVDYAALRDVLEEIDYDGFAIVEQDMHRPPLDKPLPISVRTRRFLREVGIG
jgi:inosose dehydratase